MRRCIQNNYSRIKDVERELSGLQMQLKLSTGPKKSALMMLRKKIEVQNDRVLAARAAQKAAKKARQQMPSGSHHLHPSPHFIRWHGTSVGMSIRSQPCVHIK